MNIKVCGMKHNTEAVAGLLPEYIGIILWEGSPRYFDGDLPGLPEGIKKVGVFVDAPVDTILYKIQQYGLHAVQLHGKESPEMLANLKQVLKKTAKEVSVIKVFSIKDTFDFDALIPYETHSDFFLFDTRGELPGGNGYAFDWRVLEGYPSKTPFFLSGGIGPDALPLLRDFMERPESRYCHAIDINSRFETAPGMKALPLVEAFIRGLKTGNT